MNKLKNVTPETLLKQIKKIKWYFYIEKIINLLNAKKYRFYFVGGIIRDVIFALIKYRKLEDVKDVDIVVEIENYESLLEIIKSINFETQVTIKPYPSFLTLSVFIDEKYRIDLSLPRKEYYPKPASLPVVEKGTIYDDFYRRDFTINAIGLRYDPSSSYILFDPFNGLNDILHKKIRVLHEKSFIDDPTRIIRAIRFAATFKFKLENNTEEYLKEAIDKRVLGLVSTTRLASEFINILYKGENLNIVVKLFKKYKIVDYYNFIRKIIENFMSNYKKLELKKLSFSDENKYYIRLLFLLEKVCGEIKPFETKVNEFKNCMVLLNIPHKKREQIYKSIEIFSGKGKKIDTPIWVKYYSKFFKKKIPVLKFKPSELIKYGVPNEKLDALAKYLYLNKINKINKSKIKVILKKIRNCTS